MTENANLCLLYLHSQVKMDEEIHSMDPFNSLDLVEEIK